MAVAKYRDKRGNIGWLYSRHKTGVSVLVVRTQTFQDFKTGKLTEEQVRRKEFWRFDDGIELIN